MCIRDSTGCSPSARPCEAVCHSFPRESFLPFRDLPNTHSKLQGDPNLARSFSKGCQAICARGKAKADSSPEEVSKEESGSGCCDSNFCYITFYIVYNVLYTYCYYMARGSGCCTSEKRRRGQGTICLLYTSPSPRDRTRSRMPSSA